MKRFSIFAIVTLFCCSTATFAYTPKSLVRIDGINSSEISHYANKGYDIVKAGKNFAEIVVSASEKGLLVKDGRKISTIIPDLDVYVSKRLGEQKAGAAYFTYDTMTSTLKDWAEKYPSIAKLTSIGKSCENREIWALKVSDNPDLDEKEPAVLVMGGLHAREWISVEVPMQALKEYLDGYGKDERITKLVNEREVWFVPMTNPDGVTYSQTKQKYWRKNRRNVDNRNFGVDLNRNFSYKWGMTGASNSPSSDVYHGSKAFSEPETTAIKELAEKQKFQASVSFHSYSELVLFPFGYDYNVPCENTPTLSKLAEEMAEFNKYKAENSAELYPVMGDSDDYLHGTFKTLAFTIELAQEFIPAPAEIVDVTKINVPAVIHLIDKSAAYAVNTPSGDEGIAKNLDVDSAIDALVLGEKMLPEYTGDSRLKVSDRLEIASNRLAELVAADLLSGKTASWDKIKTSASMADVCKKVKNRILFNTVHGQVMAPEIALEMQRIR